MHCIISYPKKILCKYIKDPSLGECPDGDDCPYNHDPNSDLLKSKGKAKGASKGAASRQPGLDAFCSTL